MFMIETRRGKKEKRNLEETEFLALNRGMGKEKNPKHKNSIINIPRKIKEHSASVKQGGCDIIFKAAFREHLKINNMIREVKNSI